MKRNFMNPSMCSNSCSDDIETKWKRSKEGMESEAELSEVLHKLHSFSQNEYFVAG